MYQYPYGNAQQLNLDWILNKLKELEASLSGGIDLEAVSNALIALNYAEQNYNFSDIVFYNGKLYSANQNITAEPWNPDHWNEVLLANPVSNLVRYVSALNNSQVSNVSNVPGTHTSDALNNLAESLNGAINSLAALRAKAGAKNFIPYPYSDTTKTTNGITFTDNQDGSVGINGTATDWTYFALSTTDFGNSDIYSTIDNNPVYKAILINGTTNVFIVYYNSSKKTYIAIRPNTEVNNITVYPMMCFKEETDTTNFELYAKTNVQLTEDVDNLNGAINDEHDRVTYAFEVSAYYETSTTATLRTYAVGDYVIINDRLWKVTGTVPQGTSFTGHITRVYLSDEVKTALTEVTPITRGGTNATTANNAKANLGLGTMLVNPVIQISRETSTTLNIPNNCRAMLLCIPYALLFVSATSAGFVEVKTIYNDLNLTFTTGTRSLTFNNPTTVNITCYPLDFGNNSITSAS